MEETFVALDVGTTKTCTLIAEVKEEGGLRIVGVGIAPSRGLRKGVVVNVEEATEAIAASVSKAEDISGYEIDRGYVGVSGGHISSVNSRGVAAISRGVRGVTLDDMDRAMDAAQAIAIPHNREIIHAIPRGYTVDGQDGVRNPLGLQGYRLEVEAHVVTGAVPPLHNLVKCVRAAGVEIIDLVLTPIAAGEAVLTTAEKEMGVVLADIGGGTTDIAIFIDGSVWHTMVLSVGGNHLTNDIAIGLRAPFNVAEEIKIEHGHTLPEVIAPEESIDIAAFGNEPRRPISRRRLAQIIEARAEEIFDLVFKEIKRSGYDGLLPAGLVLCGGTAKLPGLREFGSRALDLPARVGNPQKLEGLVETLESPAYATSVGLLLWGLRRTKDREIAPRTTSNFSRRLRGWLKALLPG
ncbi:MAG: cell division protein FtsA [Anaerolineae bacterium]